MFKVFKIKSALENNVEETHKTSIRLSCNRYRFER